MDFDLLGFAAHVAKLTVAVAAEEHALLDRAARVVKREAKKAIGHYQDDNGPFGPWAWLKPDTLAEKEHGGYAPPDNPELRDGTLRASYEHTVVGREAYIGSDDPVAEWQELGTQGWVNSKSGRSLMRRDTLPPRSILGGAAFRKSHEVRDLIGGSFVGYLCGKEVFEGRLAIEDD